MLELMFYKLAIFLLFNTSCQAWHFQLNLTDENYYCWPQEASERNLMLFPTCPGIDFKWVQPRPNYIQIGTYQEPWNVAFSFSLQPKFFDWAIKDFGDGFKKNLFRSVNTSSDILDSVSAETWCRSTQCLENPARGNCCFSLIQLHSCFVEEDDLCLPWLHSNVTQGKIHFSTSSTGNSGIWTINMTDSYFKIGLVNLVVYFELPGVSVIMKRQIQVTSNISQIWVIACTSSLCLLGLVILTTVLGWKCHEKHTALLDESWIISKGDLFPERMSVIKLFSKDGTPVIHKEDEHLVDFESSPCQVTQFNGPVVVKRYDGDDMQLTKKLRKEVMQVRSLKHANICEFIGASSSPPYLYIVMEYCRRGSLSDIILDDEVQLSWKFRLQFAYDIICGLRYLYKQNMYHGNLKSTNCLIDKFWTVKLADFGIESLRNNTGECNPSLLKRKKAVSKIYQPPEYDPDVLIGKHMQTVDIYAYGIILIELLNRQPPYMDFDPQSLSPSWKPPIPMFKQDETEDNKCPCEQDYTKLILYCLSDVHKVRPTLKKAKWYVEGLQTCQVKEHKDVSRKLCLLEAYSSILEVHVKEEKAELETEKQKVIDLYNVMVPKTLRIESIIAGGECFKDCTVYFSDVVGFTALVASSTPKLVVSLLNEVYLRFHAVMEKYDVCIIEVIGDGYLAVSGAPYPNKNHADEMANMSLELLQQCETFPLPEKQEENLVIRIGLHSGCVYGGVVHHALPKFHIFGDTVTMASRIEASSKAMKIHISDTTHKYLDESGDYELEERNSASVTGMRTWWLLGRSCPELPEPGPSYESSRISEVSTRSEYTSSSDESDSQSESGVSSLRKVSVLPTGKGGIPENVKSLVSSVISDARRLSQRRVDMV